MTATIWRRSHGALTREEDPLNEPDDADKLLLKALQDGIPLTGRPFEEIGKRAGLSENESIRRINRMLDTGILRKVGAIISPRKLGYVSTLAAINVPDFEVERISEFVNGFAGVTHNYLREGEPNIWFTMTELDAETLDRNITEIEKETGLEVLRMPVEKMYRIGVKFDF